MNYDDYDKLIDNAVNARNESEFCFALESLWDQYELLSVGLERSENIFWRARIIETEKFQNIKELLYPDAEKVKKAGRINDERSPCFYASTREETALAEVDAKEGQLIQLAGFKILSDKDLRLALIGEYSHVQKTGYRRFMGVDPNKTITRLLNSHPENHSKAILYIDNFLSDILSNKEAHLENYFKSRALASFIHAKIKLHGITFPSVKDIGGTNLGIKPEAYHQTLHNVACTVVEINKIRKYGFIEYTPILKAQKLDENGNFLWTKNKVSELFYLYGITQEEHEKIQPE